MKPLNESGEAHPLLIDFVDYIMPRLTPAEASMYLYLLRHTVLAEDRREVRLGNRTIAVGYGAGSRGVRTNFQYISEVTKRLEAKGCIEIGDTTRDGKLYRVRLPREVPMVIEGFASRDSSADDDDWYGDDQRRLQLFERDGWKCQYCGDTVDRSTATLDHFVPQSKGGSHGKDNLRTSCLLCNSLKAGKTYEEAAPHILKSIRERKK